MVIESRVKISFRDVRISYEARDVLKLASLDVYEKEILSVIGPASSGKTTLLRTLNRLNDKSPGFKVHGQILLDGKHVYQDYQPWLLRKKVGMIFALPTPLPLSIYENVAYGPQVHGVRHKVLLDEIVEKSLKQAFLWDEVKDRLQLPAMRLSGGQQQRLCIARTLAVEPEVILFDEPCSGLDPISTSRVEEAMSRLKSDYTQILVTNNTKQAARVGDRTAFFLMGEMVEVDHTDKMFTVPKDPRTEDYISGRFG